MKTTSRILAFLLIALSVATCKKDSVFDENGYYGEGTATINGWAWHGTNLMIGDDKAPEGLNLDNCLNIRIAQKSPDGLLLSTITFSYISPNMGSRTLNYVSPGWNPIVNRIIASEWDDDVLLGTYYVFEQSDSNFLDITDLNWETGDVKGHFQATLIRDSSWVAPGQTADTLRIRNGSFYGKIYREN